MLIDHARVAGYFGLLCLVVAGGLWLVLGLLTWPLWLLLALDLGGLTWYLTEKRDEALAMLRSRSARGGANSVLYTLLFLAVAVLMQALLSAPDWSLDLTKQKNYSLSDETLKTVKGLGEKIKVYAFFGQGEGPREELDSLLKRVRKLNPARFDYEFVDVNKKPLLASRLAVRQMGVSVLVAGANEERAETFNGTKEEDLLNALAKVLRSNSKVVYSVVGHQERGLQDQGPEGAGELAKVLGNAGFNGRSINLVLQPELPADAASLLILGSQTEFQPSEIKALDNYMARGGRLVIAIEPRKRHRILIAWLAKAGIQVGDDLVLDYNPFNQVYGGSPLAPIVNTFDPTHPITQAMARQQGQMLLPLVSSVTPSEPAPDGVFARWIVRSLPSAFAWRGSGAQAPRGPGPKDLRGPVDLVAVSEVPVSVYGGKGDAKARLLVIGSAMLLSNQAIVGFNNQDFLVNGVRWLGDEEQRIAIAPKAVENAPLLLDAGRLKLIWLGSLGMFLAALITGGVIFVRRRRAV